MGRLQDKVMLITGGNSGIGRATALLAAREGARVALTGRDRERGLDVGQEIEAIGGEAVFIGADIANVVEIAGVVRFERTDTIYYHHRWGGHARYHYCWGWVFRRNAGCPFERG